MDSRSTWATRPDGARAELGTVIFQGREFTALGAVVTPTHATGYPKAGKLLSWDGQELGTCHVVARWQVGSWTGSHMHQIEATIDGVRYTGRGFGDGMLWRGKRKAR